MKYLLVIFTLCILCTAVRSQNLNTQKIYPGVWKITAGTPEKYVPTKYAYRQPAERALLSDKSTYEEPAFIKTLKVSVTGRGLRLIADMDPAEHIYGMGLNTWFFDKTDKRIITGPKDDPESKEGYSHAPCPFFVSTKGYGVFVDTYRYMNSYFGLTNPLYVKDIVGENTTGGEIKNTEDLYSLREIKNKTMLLEIPYAQGADIYVFAADDITGVTAKYNLFSGGGCVPPLWGLGMRYHGDSYLNAEENLKLADIIRRDRIPCDMWCLENVAWQTHTYPCTFVWNRDNFADPDGFISEMKKRNIRTTLWQHAFTHIDSPIYDSLKPWSGDFRVWGGLVPDFALKEARDIYSGHITRETYERGIEGVKLDECDHQPTGDFYWSFPDASEFPSGMTGDQYHSAFGYLYQRTVLEGLGNKRSWNLARNTHALAAPLPFNIYTDAYNEKCYLRGMANTGFCGTLWEPEVRDAFTVEELYRRTQICLFAPQLLINAWFLKLPPWLQIDKNKNAKGELLENHEEVTQVMKDLFELRNSFIPYMYSAFNDYYRRGIAPMRALVMDSPEDTNTYGIDNQFMIGDRVMAAPALTGSPKRSVYFPKGSDWVDYYTGKRYRGGTRAKITVPIERLPLYVKDNCILPVAEPVEYTAPDTCYRVIVKVYGTGEKGFVLYEDDGETYDYEKGLQNRITLSIRNGKNYTARAGGYTGAPRYEIAGWSQEPDGEYAEETTLLSGFDGRGTGFTYKQGINMLVAPKEGDTMEFSYYGDGVIVRGMSFPDCGIADVFIDGRKVGEHNMYTAGANQPFERIYKAGSAGRHTLLFVNTGRKEEVSAGTFVNVTEIESE